MKQFRIIGSVLALALAVVSCNRTGGGEVVELRGNYEGGILVSNEGNFGRPNGELSFIDYGLSKIQNGVYKTVNKEDLGDTFQSIAFKGDQAYLVVNNSNKIVIANRYTMKKEAEITQGIRQPRYIAFNGDYTYVTNNDYFANKKSVSIYDKTNTLVKNIEFTNDSEKIVSSGNYVYVQTDGATGEMVGQTWVSRPTGHTITRINASTNEVDKTITLSDNGIIRDVVGDNSNVYVLSETNETAYIYRINANTGEAQQFQYSIPNASKLSYNNGRLFVCTNNKIYWISSTTTARELFTLSYNPYEFEVIDNAIFVSQSHPTDASTVFVYNFNGVKIGEFKAGSYTSGFYKN